MFLSHTCVTAAASVPHQSSVQPAHTTELHCWLCAGLQRRPRSLQGHSGSNTSDVAYLHYHSGHFHGRLPHNKMSPLCFTSHEVCVIVKRQRNQAQRHRCNPSQTAAHFHWLLLLCTARGTAFTAAVAVAQPGAHSQAGVPGPARVHAICACVTLAGGGGGPRMQPASCSSQ
jgi:hypothetical protein